MCANQTKVQFSAILDNVNEETGLLRRRRPCVCFYLNSKGASLSVCLWVRLYAKVCVSESVPAQFLARFDTIFLDFAAIFGHFHIFALNFPHIPN